MRARQIPAGATGTRLTLVLAAAAAVAVPAAGAAPPPCPGDAQITDATGDGHHSNTDVLAAWITEATGRPQAVVKVKDGIWEPAHDDSEAAGFALLYDTGGQTRFVRALAGRAGVIRFEHGLWTGSGFLPLGTTTGETTTGLGATVTIDIPPEAFAPAGAVLTRLFALTWDGESPAGIHWVDRAPGGETPAGGEFGADLLVGACAAAVSGGVSPAPAAAGAGAGGPAVTALALRTPVRVVGGGRVLVQGAITPAAGGVPVTVTRSPGPATGRIVTTEADGTFRLRIPVTQATLVTASAGGLSSATRKVAVRPVVRITIRRSGGSHIVAGRIRPALSGRVLLLAPGAARPAATAPARAGVFRIDLGPAARGAFQAVFVPSGGRAERATSNTGVIR